MKSNIVVYPYNEEFDPIVKYSHFLTPEHQICALVSLKGWGYTDREVNLSNGSDLIVHSKLNSVIHDVNCIWIPNIELIEQVQTKVIEEIANVINDIEQIICCAKLTSANMNLLKQLCANSKSNCVLEIKSTMDCVVEQDFNCEYNHIQLREVGTPIIAIAGLWENVDKFYTSLILRNQFIKNGYDVSQVGSQNCCEMMGFHSFPDFMFDYNIGAEKKIVLFNKYIYDIVKLENPDVIIIGIPGATQSLNEKYTAGFGVLPYLVFKSVSVDFLMMCTFYESNGTEFLKKLDASYEYRYDCHVDCFHMSNYFIDFTGMLEKSEIVSNRINREYVQKNICENYASFPIPLYNLDDIKDQEKLFIQVIDKLSNQA